MSKQIAILLSSLFLLTPNLTLGVEIHLEHSFVPEGSSWGTEDDLRRAIDLPADKVPAWYKLPSTRKPVYAATDTIPLAAGRFVQSKAALYRGTIRLCLHSSLPPVSPSLQVALDTFLDNIAGTKQNGRLFSMQVVRVASIERNIGCDLIAVKGDRRTFPYKHLPDEPTLPSSSNKGKVYGIFYRWSHSSVPILTFHPEIEFTFDPPSDRYVTTKNGKIFVDGKALLLHEVGHFFGFAHIDQERSTFDFPEATAMGTSAYNWTEEIVRLRFDIASNLWRYWDAFQTTIYRRLWQQEFGGGDQ